MDEMVETAYLDIFEMVETAYLDIFPPPIVVIASAQSASGVFFSTFVIDITVNGQWKHFVTYTPLSSKFKMAIYI